MLSISLLIRCSVVDLVIVLVTSLVSYWHEHVPFLLCISSVVMATMLNFTRGITTALFSGHGESRFLFLFSCKCNVSVGVITTCCILYRVWCPSKSFWCRWSTDPVWFRPVAGNSCESSSRDSSDPPFRVLRPSICRWVLCLELPYSHSPLCFKS
jgi:hypothetical protein